MNNTLTIDRIRYNEMTDFSRRFLQFLDYCFVTESDGTTTIIKNRHNGVTGNVPRHKFLDLLNSIEESNKKYILTVEVEPRYFEDAAVNGDPEDDDNPKMPFVINGKWSFKINVASGTIIDWPVGVTASTHYKVCDAGCYSLSDSSGGVWTIDGENVPSFMCPMEPGYGDYIIMKIDHEGKIEGWESEFCVSYMKEIGC